MDNRARLKQAWTIAKVELRRAFFSKRAIWVYILALFPSIIFLGYSLTVKVQKERLSTHGLTKPALIDSIRPEETDEDIVKRVGKPAMDFQYQWNPNWNQNRRRGNQPVPPDLAIHTIKNRTLTYFDGKREVRIQFTNGKQNFKNIRQLANFEEDRRVFAGLFQYFYLKLAIFFGCLGIFMNLFRGEMMDRTLHFWFLLPSRREVLLAGKYGAGLIASTTIFAGGALLCFGIMLQTHNAAEVSSYWQSAGMAHAFWYAVTAAMGCIGYGSVFLVSGLLIRNPIIPAAVLLVWESINSFLPIILQKFSVFYYLQSLCPTPAPADENMPALLRMLLSPAAPASRTWSIIGLFVLTALVLWVARYAVRRMQISYGADS
jgi:hypothetical protein